MKRWGSWLLALAVASGTTTRAQGQFTPPMPTPAPGGFAPGMPTPVGDAMPIGPSTLGEGSAPSAMGPGIAPPPNMLQLGNNPNAFDDDILFRDVEWGFYSSFTVDFLTLWTAFDKNPAYLTTQSAPGGAPVSVGFGYDGANLTPRLNMDLRFGPGWGVRGSWMQMDRNSRQEFAGNTSNQTVVASPLVLPGAYRVTESDQIAINNAFVRNIQSTFIEKTPLQVQSPRAYWFTDVVPRQALLPPSTGNALPPFTLSSAVQAGFPDFLAFKSSYNTLVADLELTHRIEFNRATGLVGLGVRYGYISHSYTAFRGNQGGSNIIPGYDPFITIMIDAVINTEDDHETLWYSHNFGGVGPKLSFEVGTEITSFARLYSKFNGSLLMGGRKEIAFYEAQQAVTISDISRQPPADLFYRRTVIGQQAGHRDVFTCIPVGEVEGGIEVAMGGRFFPVFKLGFFGQWWLGGGNASNPNGDFCVYGINASLGIGF